MWSFYHQRIVCLIARTFGAPIRSFLKLNCAHTVYNTKKQAHTIQQAFRSCIVFCMFWYNFQCCKMHSTKVCKIRGQLSFRFLTLICFCFFPSTFSLPMSLDYGHSIPSNKGIKIQEMLGRTSAVLA